jgi:hypothetical protein
MKLAASVLAAVLASVFFWVGSPALAGWAPVSGEAAAAGTPGGVTNFPDSAEPQSPQGPVYVVYYWRARPGREAEYSAYIRDFAEPIDEEARRAGVFEEVRTYTPFLRTGAPGADWTHMRVFKLQDFSALDGFSAGLDAAMDRVFPDAAQRPSSAGLRDLVRQEIWRDF